MKKIDGIYWPDSDREAHPVVPRQALDMEIAVRLCQKRKRTDTCIQAGGNVGVWPLRLAKSFKRVITYEPCRENYACLIQNVGDNERIIPFIGALGAYSGQVQMALYPRNAGAHFVAGTITGEEHATHPGGGHPIAEPVAVSAIDDMHLDALDFLVLDIEGYEPLALQGARETIERFKPILMIEDKGLSERYGRWPKGWTQDMNGYRIVKSIHRDVILEPEE